MEGEGTETHGYIANLGVLPSHRKSRIAKKLMDAAQNALIQEYGSEYVSLHVRKSNQASINLYSEKLGYNYEIAANFYENGEDAYVMQKQLQEKQTDILGTHSTDSGDRHKSSVVDLLWQALSKKS
ncbi:hypothetical protein C5167_000362 [Papaver somniferum]|uniref:N-acetyltransferase domain-containing protein n=2 Tax=Papaver somniferum TaxID=3469 RepID=A0A4Y7KTZ5_PAPSO|nr:hypothetical protein C5167_000362 [Papaver somniferum]